MIPEQTVLKVLGNSWPHAVAERTLRNEVNLEAREAVTLADLLYTLGQLEKKAQAAKLISEDTDDEGHVIRKWRITDNGRARLA